MLSRRERKMGMEAKSILNTNNLNLVRHRLSPVLLAVAVCAFIGVGGVLPSAAQQPRSRYISVQPNEQVFDIMCALDAAGFDADSPTLDIYPAHAALRQRLLQLRGPATLDVRQYYQKHAFINSDETLAPFLTFAMIVGPPPDFSFTVARDDIPPSATSVDDFGPVLRNFYNEAHLGSEWIAMQPEVNQEIARLTDPLRQIVFRTTGYLRELMTPESSRTFTVYVEPLVGNRVDFRNIGNHYAMVVGPGSVLPLDSIRHGFLHFMLDPLVLKNQQIISTRRALLQIADRAPQFPTAYHDDFVGFFDECLVRAAELRLEKRPAAQVEAVLQNNDRTGFILVRPIYQQLITFEKAEPAMSFYFPTLVSNISVAAQEKRFQNFEFASSSEKIAPGGIAGEAEATSADLELKQELMQGDRQIAMQDGKGAAATFQSVLDQHPKLPRALYGLAIASVLQGDGQKAENLFEQLVHTPGNASNNILAPTPDILAWSHVYLGRIRDLQGARGQAEAEYKAALAVAGAPEQARVAAQQGINAPYAPPSKEAQH
jgi:tetratricopeptide (TPR) repeat protein